MRVAAAEAAVLGLFPDVGAADAAALAIATALRPISDVRSTAEYRLTVAQNVVKRFVLGLQDR